MKGVQARGNLNRPLIYHGWRRILYSWPILIILFIILGFLVRASWRVYGNWSESREMARLALLRYQNDKARLEMLQREVTRLGTKRGVEEELRRKFPVSLPGEEVVIIVDDQASTTHQ